jgi:hypothetical protein
MARALGLGGLLLAATLAAGCGGANPGPPARPAGGPGFAWLHPAAAPSGWRRARIPSGAVMSYPPGWRALRSDPGTASVALLGPHGRFDAYLNVTPRQSTETLANWARFRVAHDREEGDRSVRILASARGLRFRGGRGSCVRDRSATQTGAVYVEVACLVAGAHSTVVVAAAPPADWASQGPALERAIDAFSA